MTASRALDRRAARAALLALAAALFACAAMNSAGPRPEELLRSFESGDVRLDCTRCRYDFRSADWLLEQGDYERLVVEILSTGDGSGRSWYLLGRVAEATDRRELALHYYQEALATARNPIIALWPLYEDLNFRVRRLATKPVAGAAGTERASASRESERENVNVDALVVLTRPGAVGAFVEKLRRGDVVEVIDRSGDWEEIRLADGRVGWAWAAYTTVPGAEPAPERAAAKPARPRRAAKPAPRKRAPEPAPKAEVAKPAEPMPSPYEAIYEATRGAREARERSAASPETAAPETTAEPADAKPPTAVPPAPTVAALPHRPARTTTSKALAKLRSGRPAAEPPAPLSSLAVSGDAGILGCPLPRGAELSGRSHGSEGAADHPTESYAIDAPAQEILGFYEREMQRAGWRKSFAASEFLLYFEKDGRTVGVLIERKGGLFTLMGS